MSKIGFLRQVYILVWKNGILFRRSYIGSIFEVFLSIFFIAALIIVRFYVDKTNYQDQSNKMENIFDTMPLSIRRNRIYYYPNNNYVRNIIVNAVLFINSYDPLFTPIIIGFNSNNCSSLGSTAIYRLMAFVSFPSNISELNSTESLTYSVCSQEGNIYKYNVDQSLIKKSEFLWNRSPEDYCYERTYFFLYDIFNAIKYSIDLELIRLRTNASYIWNNELLNNQQYSCPSYRQDDLLSTFLFLIPLIINLSYVSTCLVLVGKMISEKESKMKEYLKLVGIKWYAFPISIFIHSFSFYTIVSALITIATKVKLPPANINGTLYYDKALFEYTEPMIVFSVLFIYSIQLSLFTILLAQFFSKPFIAKVITIILWLLTSFDFYNYLPTSFKYFLCFLPNLALTFSIEVISQFERSSVNFTFKYLYSNHYDDDLNVGIILTLMLVYSLLYIPLIWYTEKVLPGEFGIPLPFYFIFQPSYWKNLYHKKKDNIYSLDDTNKKVKIRLSNVTKFMYDGFRRKRVLDDLSLDFKENEITCLLGVNGAGKSTLMNILCGMYPPSKGKINIFGYDLQTEFDLIRHKIGFCPQHDIHYSDLTVGEHFKLIAQIKGFKGNDLSTEIDRIAKYVKLDNDLNTKSKDLSGGMKRRLSIGLALIGDTKIILLDEATSGMDPFNRRILWELIKNYKNERTIVFTTHFIDECDVLADRIAIINNGRIKCNGSPLVLKALHGNGFRLVISKSESFDEKKFVQYLVDKSVTFKTESNVSSEICLNLINDENFELCELLKSIEESKDRLGILSYGINHSTIDEVFFKFANNHKEFQQEEFNELSLKAFKTEFSHRDGVSLLFHQFITLFKKRFITFYRRYILAAVILTIPLVIQALVVYFIPSQTYLIESASGTLENLGSYKINIENYNPQIIPYSFYGSSNYTIFENFLVKYFNTKGIQAYRVEISNNQTIDQYVLAKRKENNRNLYDNYYAGLSFNVTNNDINQINVSYSTMAYHSSAAIVDTVTNLLLGYSLNSTRSSIKTINTPIPANSSLYTGNRFLQYLACFDVIPMSILNILTSIIIAFIISVLVMFPTMEKSSGFKTLQLLTGTNFFIYWLAHYLFDLILCLINASILVSITKLVDMAKNDTTSETYAVSKNDNIGYVALIIFTSSLCWPVLAHIWSFFIKSNTKSFVVLFILLGVFSFGDVLLEFLLIVINAYKNDKSVKLSSSDVIYVVRIALMCIFPNINVKRGLYSLKARNNVYCTNTVNDLIEASINTNEEIMSLQEPGIGINIFISFLQLIVFWAILIIIETKLIQKIWRYLYRPKIISDFNKEHLESDVQFEYDRINQQDLENLKINETLVVKNICKAFKKGNKKFLAVNHLSFGIDKNQCFGLLGLNGAGKSTFLKILSGEIKSTSGSAFINGQSIDNRLSKIRNNLGFCPQNDYLPDYMTVKECLLFFAQLKGMYIQDAEQLVNELIKLFRLDIYNYKMIKNLSGGNKRKVSAAIAFIGKPLLVILDEPTSNMDPISKRYLWKVINKARDLGITIIQTSHAMEECEALCTKLAIMVNGQFQCLGNLQHLKKKYGKGYTLKIKLKKEPSRISDILSENFERIILKDKQDLILTFEINDNTSIAKLFEKIEQNKNSLNIETYTITQTTLEDVFIQFASKQQNEQNETTIRSFFSKLSLKFCRFKRFNKTLKINIDH